MLISCFDKIMLCKMLILVDAGWAVNWNLYTVCKFSVTLKLLQNKSFPKKGTNYYERFVWRTKIYNF